MGVMVHTLVDQLLRDRIAAEDAAENLAAVATVVRAITGGDDPRPMIVEAARALAAGSAAVLLEPTDDGLLVTHATGVAAAGLLLPSGARRPPGR